MLKLDNKLLFLTGPPNRPVLYCWLLSVVVCNAAGGRAGRPTGAWRSGGRHCTAGQSCHVPYVRATPCFKMFVLSDVV